MTTTTTHPGQVLLPGQAAAPDGPADMTMMYVMHHAFRRDLGRFADAVAATPLEDRSTWQALADRWGLFSEILHHHHAAEDELIWPFLLEQADAEEQRTLEAMEEEHGLIDPLLRSVADGFTALAADREPSDGEGLRRALEDRTAATRDLLARHLAHEETEAIAVLQRHTTTATWTAIEEQIGKRKNPVSLFTMVGWCAEEVPAEQLEEVFALVGTPFKVLWWLSRGSFRRGERSAFRYVGRVSLGGARPSARRR